MGWFLGLMLKVGLGFRRALIVMCSKLWRVAVVLRVRWGRRGRSGGQGGRGKGGRDICRQVRIRAGACGLVGGCGGLWEQAGSRWRGCGGLAGIGGIVDDVVSP